MPKTEAIAWIDEQVSTMINPVSMLNGVWLRVIINHIPDDVWDEALEEAAKVLSQ